MNAQHNEMTMDEMDQVNGGVVLLVIVALKPSTTRKGNSTQWDEINDVGTSLRKGNRT
jgi:hypothetical protein